MTSPNTPYLPTEEEYAAAKAKIQAGWTERDWWKRAGLPEPGTYDVPTVPAKLLLGPGNVEKGTI